MIKKIHNLSRKNKQIIILIVDAALIVFALFIAYSLRLGAYYIPELAEVWLWILAPILSLMIFIRFDLFRVVIEHVELKAIWDISKAVTLYSLVFGMVVLISGAFVPRSVILINWLAAIVLITGSRFAGRWVFSNIRSDSFFSRKTYLKNVIIYGAGSSGVQIARALSASELMNPVAFVDDHLALQKQVITGLKVFSPNELHDLIVQYRVGEILLAMPSVPKNRTKQIIAELEELSVPLSILPVISELIEGDKGKVNIEDIRDIHLDDLLGREAVIPDCNLMSKNVTDKVVMVTGAGGSIGFELCCQIVMLNPKLLIIYEMSEYSLYILEKILISQGFNPISILGSVVDRYRVERTCKKFQVETIYHAAAYKHVPLVETNPSVGVVNNVMGTLNSAQAAIDADVDTFVLISTDKAVRPTNIMGASKRFSELVLQALDLERKKQGFSTSFIMVRFGNVLGSSGSVVPLFREQIKLGGPVTVTHKDIIRYFMSIAEASQLVIQAGALGKGGDVFVLDMGEPVKIFDLAKHMVQLSGLELKDEQNPQGDIEIEFCGLRPGEKLYEELLIGDNVSKTSHSRILRAEEKVISWDQVKVFVHELSMACQHNDTMRVREVLKQAIPEYSPQCGVVDVLSGDI